MKKIKKSVLTILIFVAILFLSGCSDNSSNENSSTSQEDSFTNTVLDGTRLESTNTQNSKESSDAAEIVKDLIGIDLGVTDVRNLTEDAKLSIIGRAGENGLNAEFSEDIIVLTDENGNKTEYGEIAVEPYNLIYGKIPAPGSGMIILKGCIDKGEYVIVISGVSTSDVDTYVKAAQKEGFKKDVDIDDGSEDGVYLFSAYNSTGDSLEVSFRGTTMMITLLEPKS